MVKSFNDSLKEVNDIAGQHELLAEQLKGTIYDVSKLPLSLCLSALRQCRCRRFVLHRRDVWR